MKDAAISVGITEGSWVRITISQDCRSIWMDLGRESVALIISQLEACQKFCDLSEGDTEHPPPPAPAGCRE